MSEPNDSRRLELVAAAQRQWIDALTDLGGRNTLLYFKDRRAGTLDLAGADPEMMERFVRTGSARLTKLFRDADLRADAIHRVQTIYRKARELSEERGIRAAYLATGLARWDELFLEPAAPVLLRGLTITPTRARYDDFDLLLEDEEEVNPVLLHKLACVFGAVIEKPAPERIAGQLARAAAQAEIPGFGILRRRVIGTFTYAKLPMVRDLEAAGDLLADSDLVAAIAGDAEAQRLVSADREPVSPSDDPEDDYSVLDADSSQRSAIDTVLEGRSLVIHGPPGTGKSQTIANLIAAMVARGRKVLFVAEKRAAIDAVLSRLVGVNLGDMVLDIHEGTRDRQRIAAGLGATLDLAGHATAPDTASLRRRLVDRKRRLTRHSSALHKVHEPWGLSAYDVQSALLGIPARARGSARLAAPEEITPELADRVRDDLREFAHLGGFTLRPGGSPWLGAALHDREQAREAVDRAVLLSTRTLPRLTARLSAACTETGLRRPASQAEKAAVLALFAALRDAERAGFRERRALRKQARAQWEELRLAGPGGTSQNGTSQHGTSQHGASPGRAAGLDGEPRLPSGYPALAQAWQDAAAQVDALAAVAPLAGLDEDPDAAAAALAADQETPWKLPRLHELARRFGELGLAPLLDEVTRGAAGPDAVTPDLIASAFDHAWYRSVLDQIRVRDPDYGAEYGAALDEIAEEFRRRDVEHLAANRSRVRSAWAGQLRDTVARHPLQARVIRKQAALRRGHLPLRRLLDQTSDVLFALKPCWAMSPLMVSQVLPASRLFDLVIFDEASQIVPADAIGSMIRAHQVVVAGDDHQLPPTNFFRQVDSGDPGDDDDLDEELVSFGAGFESVLDALTPLLPTCPLNWHYRSRDERLVAFSNDRIYGGALTTFPGVARDDCLRHVVVSSVDDEVTEVVRLILEHARQRPGESLGVIALGMRHAERVDTALRAALAAVPDEARAPGTVSLHSWRWGGCRVVLRRGCAGAVLRQEPGARAGRRAGRDHPVGRLRQARRRADAVSVGAAAAGRRRAPAERRGDPGQAPADRGQLVLRARRGPGAADQGGRPAARRVPGVRRFRRHAGRRVRVGGRAGRVRGGRGGPARGVRDHRGPAVRRRRLPGRLRRCAPRRPGPDDPGRRGRRRVLPGLRERPRPGPAAQGAPGAARLAGAPAVVHQLVPGPRGRAGPAPRGLPGRGPRPAARAPPPPPPPPPEDPPRPDNPPPAPEVSDPPGAGAPPGQALERLARRDPAVPPRS